MVPGNTGRGVGKSDEEGKAANRGCRVLELRKNTLELTPEGNSVEYKPEHYLTQKEKDLGLIKHQPPLSWVGGLLVTWAPFLPLSTHFHPSAPFTSATLASLLFFKPTRLFALYSLTTMISPQIICIACSLNSFKSLLKCHFLRKNL